MEIYRVFMKLSPKTGVDFASHTACRLGKWYDEGDGKECFSKLPSYREVEFPHKDVHTAGKVAVESFLQGNHGEALTQALKMEQASILVMPHLENMAIQSPEESCLIN